MAKKLTDNELIDALGGTSATAEFFEIKPPSVSAWRKKGIPRDQKRYLRLARPDLFEGERQSKRRNQSRNSP